MKRITIKLVVFLLLGAVVNVGVAWGCAARSQPFESIEMIASGSRVQWTAMSPGVRDTLFLDLSGYQFTVANPHRYLTGPIVSTRDPQDTQFYGLNLGTIDPGSPVSDRKPTQWSGARRLRAGWPTLSLTGEALLDSDPWLRLASRGLWTVGLGPDSREQIHLPVSPIFLGFLINTLFYGVILWLLWSAPFATRRRIRKRRGRCVKCGYDLTGAGHVVCPECGKTLTPALSRRERG